MTTRPSPELPYYFGPGGQLFGLYHRACRPTRKAVLLCAPFGQEQIRTHRLYRQLARTLAANGVDVLRFDYYATGDSAGFSVELDWNRCVTDAVAAADELRSRSGCDHVVAFGARFGGSVAIAATTGARFAEIVLWDPVLDGATQVARLDGLHATMRADKQRFLTARAEPQAVDQWLGFAINSRLREQLATLQLSLPETPTLILNSRASAVVADPTPTGVTTVTLEAATPWESLDHIEIAILSHPLIQATNSYLQEAAL